MLITETYAQMFMLTGSLVAIVTLMLPGFGARSISLSLPEVFQACRLAYC
jgi:hypothetical protein